MLTGVIKFYSARRGYGFICCNESDSKAMSIPGSDVYVHYSQITGLGDPHEGQAVTFDVKSGYRGPEAVNVQPAI